MDLEVEPCAKFKSGPLEETAPESMCGLAVVAPVDLYGVIAGVRSCGMEDKWALFEAGMDEESELTT